MIVETTSSSCSEWEMTNKFLFSSFLANLFISRQQLKEATLSHFEIHRYKWISEKVFWQEIQLIMNIDALMTYEYLATDLISNSMVELLLALMMPMRHVFMICCLVKYLTLLLYIYNKGQRMLTFSPNNSNIWFYASA